MAPTTTLEREGEEAAVGHAMATDHMRFARPDNPLSWFCLPFLRQKFLFWVPIEVATDKAHCMKDTFRVYSTLAPDVCCAGQAIGLIPKKTPLTMWT